MGQEGYRDMYSTYIIVIGMGAMIWIKRFVMVKDEVDRSHDGIYWGGLAFLLTMAWLKSSRTSEVPNIFNCEAEAKCGFDKVCST